HGLPLVHRRADAVRVAALQRVPQVRRQSRGDDGGPVELLTADALPNVSVNIELLLVEVALSTNVSLLMRLEVVHPYFIPLAHDIDDAFDYERPTLRGDLPGEGELDLGVRYGGGYRLQLSPVVQGLSERLLPTGFRQNLAGLPAKQVVVALEE